MDDEHCYRVASSRDGRFDGAFVTAVTSTGIYCRPSCPAMTPKRANTRFFPTPAAAQDAGFRACKRCRPDAAPGSPEWNLRADLVARAMRMIGDGVVEREGISGLSRRLGYSPRQLHRLVFAELGTGPLRLAMAHRVQTARALLETTDMPVTDVAWASGFASIRQFNDQIRNVFALTPSQLRAKAAPLSRSGGEAGTIVARLSFRPPLDLAHALDFLGRRAIPGVEAYDGTTYKRALLLPHGAATLSLSASDTDPARPVVTCRLRLEDVRDYATAVSRVRRMLDLDADPGAISACFADDAVLGPLLEARPGLRVPGTVEGTELAFRAILGQQISVSGARTLTARLVRLYGDPVPAGDAELMFQFPSASRLASVEPDELPLPETRAKAVVHLARELASGSLSVDPGAERDETETRLRGIAGIGTWTSSYIRMRALGDPDVFLETDLAVKKALERPRGSRRPDCDGSAWKPWRSYATVHLWSSLSPPIATKGLPNS